MNEYKKIDIYLYDSITKEFMAKGISNDNPLDPENPLIPRYATTIEPPDKLDGYAIVWVGNKWEYKEDHRGEIWYNSKTKKIETINFIGILDDFYYTPDSVIANPPEGDYWIYDKETNTWIADITLYKQYVLNNFSFYWDLKFNTPFEFNGYRYIAQWRDLYTSIWVALKDGIKSEYRLQDYDGKYNIVDKISMKDIISKISDVVDEMYMDKQNLLLYFQKNNDFEQLSKKFQEFIDKVYS